MPEQRAKASTYVVRRGDTLSRIARRELASGSSAAGVAKNVEKLTDLNLGTRIRSGDPDFITAGERLRLP
jgi:hypothetical protein